VGGQFPDALWVAEGFTRWYEFLLCARAGELSPKRLLANVVNYHRHLTALPAYARVSAADSSRATFLNHHRFPGAVNASIDYYDKGLLIAFDLDAALRLEAGTTLDAEFRRFYEAFTASETGFTSHDAVRFFGERSPALRAMLEREVDGPGGLSTLLLLEALGFEVVAGERKVLGVVLKDASVADVPDDGPAARAGLTAGDELLRVGAFPFHAKVLAYETATADVVRLGVRRGARLLELEVRPEARPETTGLRWRGTREQLDRLRTWIGELDLTPGEAIDLGPYDNFHGIQKVV
jgi:predicted metalloprotease with PDZ domain